MQPNYYSNNANIAPSCVSEQIQNPIHLEKISDTEFKAVIKASESFSVCCGRNIAFISEVPSDKESGSLQTLTWVDPVTTEAVDHPSVGKRRLMDASYLDHGGRRRLGNTKGSSIHGTNGYLIPLHGTNELLGVAHFHRPEHRKESDYAKHGHHYSKWHYPNASTAIEISSSQLISNSYSHFFVHSFYYPFSSCIFHIRAEASIKGRWQQCEKICLEKAIRRIRVHGSFIEK
jgi:hypothetical protein